MTATAVATAVTATVAGASETRRQKYRWYENFMGGAVGLPLSFAVMHPLDTIKTRVQAQAGELKAQGYTGIRAYLRALSTHNVSSVLSRGFLASVAGAAPQGGLRLATYEYCKVAGATADGKPPGFFVSAWAACMGDIASSIVKVPRELVMQRVQTGMHATAGEAFQSILRTEGVRGLFTGYVSTGVRDMPFMVILFAGYEKLKQLRMSQTDTTHITSTESIVFGGVAGGVAGFATTPFDVAKTRIMTGDLPKEERRLVRVMGSIYRDLGARGLFTGASARSFWWFCVCSIFWPTFENVREIVHGGGWK